jgi:hypothetical protein
LSKKKFSNYWFSSGTPTFILKFVESNSDKVKQLIMLESSKLAATELESFSVESYFENMLVLFLQAGYLTISKYNPGEETYSLSYPNYEVRRSMTEQILKFIAHIELASFGGFVDRLRTALLNDDINAFCRTMKDFFVLLPHTIIINKEKFYHGIFFTVTKLIGAKITVEDSTNIGFIDAVLQGKSNTYVIEFKKDKTSDIALAQIKDKEYFRKFQLEDVKPIVLVGINFDYEENDKNGKGVTLDWKVVELKNSNRV